MGAAVVITRVGADGTTGAITVGVAPDTVRDAGVGPGDVSIRRVGADPVKVREADPGTAGATTNGTPPVSVATPAGGNSTDGPVTNGSPPTRRRAAGDGLSLVSGSFLTTRLVRYWLPFGTGGTDTLLDVGLSPNISPDGELTKDTPLSGGIPLSIIVPFEPTPNHGLWGLHQLLRQ